MRALMPDSHATKYSIRADAVDLYCYPLLTRGDAMAVQVETLKHGAFLILLHCCTAAPRHPNHFRAGTLIVPSALVCFVMQLFSQMPTDLDDSRVMIFISNKRQVETLAEADGYAHIGRFYPLIAERS